MSGAVVLAATAAMRAGAGYATAGITHSVDYAVSAAVPEVLTQVVSDGDVLGPDALDRFAGVLDRAEALAIGPGLGRGDEQAALVERTLDRIDMPVVVDADGLNVLAGRTERLRARSAPTVITPHPAELARLLETTTSEVQSDRLSSAIDAAHRWQCTVVLKGFRTLTADASGRVVVNPTGGPELATAGTGDVLTGLIVALLAAGLHPFEAAWAGAYIHGVAGSIAAERGDPAGVVAGDVARHLPHARARITQP